MMNCKTCEHFFLSKDEYPCKNCSGEPSKYETRTSERECETCKHTSRITEGTDCKLCVEINREYVALDIDFEETNKLFGWYWEPR
jgi:hypothetical protein